MTTKTNTSVTASRAATQNAAVQSTPMEHKPASDLVAGSALLPVVAAPVRPVAAQKRITDSEKPARPPLPVDLDAATDFDAALEDDLLGADENTMLLAQISGEPVGAGAAKGAGAGAGVGGGTGGALAGVSAGTLAAIGVGVVAVAAAAGGGGGSSAPAPGPTPSPSPVSSDLTNSATDNLVGGAGNDVFTTDDDLKLQATDTVNGGAGSDTLRVADSSGMLEDAQFTNVRNMEVLSTNTATNALGVLAAAAGFTQLVLDNGTATNTNLSGFNRTLSVNAGAGQHLFTFNLADAGNKTVRSPSNTSFDAYNLNTTGLTEGSVKVKFVSADVGNATGTALIDGSQGDITVDNTAVEIRAGQDRILKVQGVDSVGNEIADQDRGNFRVVVLGTSGGDTFSTSTAVGPFGANPAGNIYINAGDGSDMLTASAGANTRHFLDSGTGSDSLMLSTTDASGILFARGLAGNDTVTISANAGMLDLDTGDDGDSVNVLSNTGTLRIVTGNGHDNVNVTSSSVENIDFGAGDDSVSYLTGLRLNTGTSDDTLSGGLGTDRLISSSALLRGIAAANPSSRQSISGFEELLVNNALDGDLSVADIQIEINSLRLSAGTSAVSTITFAAANSVINLDAALGAAFSVTNNSAVVGAGGLTGTIDTLSIITNATATNVLAGRALNFTNIETVVINGSGLGAATTQTASSIVLGGNRVVDSSLILAGSNSFVLGSVDARAIDASGLTGAANVVLTVGNTIPSTTSSPEGARVRASRNADSIVGGVLGDSVSAGAGDDTVSGGSGNDVLDGEEGVDTVDFSALTTSGGTQGITLILNGATPAMTAAGNTGAGTDSILNFENILGSAGDDNFTGDALANRLEGLGGADALIGGGGNDTLVGGAGADALTGGDGDDLIVFSNTAASNGKDSIVGFTAGGSVDELNFDAFNIDGATGNNLVATLADQNTTMAGTQAYTATTGGAASTAISAVIGKVAFVDLGSAAVTDANLGSAIIGATNAVFAEGMTAGKAILVIKNGTAALRVAYLDDGAGASDATVTAVAELTGISDLGVLIADDFLV